MQIAVYDTYVRRTDGLMMHFDILVPSTLKDQETILNFGRKYLASKGIDSKDFSTRECRFCHVESAPAEIEAVVNRDGYYIIEMENC
ncbi:MAG TPA: DUF2024 family protein [Arenimonas sp.]|nr:DUF2024 family protein [Arenimonas sp.]